ncbi:hypothetical protein [Anaplasma marginale]|uniref:hypothetical protein n=1 Tax=Anaplasma marginale TaxID=770 RepID=UPI00030DB11B|nr:hypothetical protein [Anaplasma marginale]
MRQTAGLRTISATVGLSYCMWGCYIRAATTEKYSGDAWRYASLGPLFNSDKFRSSSGSWCCTYPATFAGWVPIRARADDVALVERVCV